ncbi:16S rRNA (cytosine(967)-C(5))-methyltransferase RsmB [Priestia megaterium]|uniref:16S rRNA (cytosine(967)-C(5))-methyltransferase RsmB n=1 Tax=Priestia megaterium TaxID=1404 RepID=UPI001866DFD6|nr:16S rRNA (cytosine(967)-C(5))-methyltransferase RsmB [Priestia megaterium]MBE2975113.1 16S rRNA (cytosine(967)-C(5))-methyltransferase RsmB [Priestia megaterium]MED3929876.1 16S rRNA (cytosine(967)-C(5))-methyltransferase RsmB [Priestia megaterium]
MSKYNVRDIALDILLAIEKNQAFSNLLLNNSIQKRGIQGKDAGLLTEIVYGTIQRRDTLDYGLAPFLKNPKKLQPWVRVLLRLSLYQMVYLDRVPDRAILHEAVEIAKKRGHKGIASMVNGVLRNIQRSGTPSLEEIQNPVERLAIETSHPLWLVKRWVEQYGLDKTRGICLANLMAPKQTIRVNSARFTQNEVKEALEKEGIVVEPGHFVEEALEVQKGNAAHTQAFREGMFTVQDESSMLVAHALGAEAEELILDSCAAPGGKSTHIAEQLKNSGKVISLDIHDHKVKLIAQQAERLHLTNIEPTVQDSRKAGEQFDKEMFDRILVDAPCSGFGVMRRKPDLKYTKTEQDVKQLARIQQDILNAVAPLLKKGGTLVYSTCTIDRDENGDVVTAFLAEHADFQKDETLAARMPQKLKQNVKHGEIQLLPDAQSDGFYIACLQKKV